MLNRWPLCKVTGIDRSLDFLDLARTRIPPEFQSRCKYEQADLFHISDYPAKEYDITTCMQTLLLFKQDQYSDVLKNLIQITRGWIFLSSLFTEKKMDVESKIRLYVPCEDYPSGTVSYNTFCTSRFRSICHGLGVREVKFKDFEIDIDLSGPEEGGLGTYTVRTENSSRLQFSGAVYMPWKFVALRLE